MERSQSFFTREQPLAGPGKIEAHKLMRIKPSGTLRMCRIAEGIIALSDDKYTCGRLAESG